MRRSPLGPALVHLFPWLILAGMLALQLAAGGLDPGAWDPMLFSGALCLTSGLALMADLPGRARRALLRAAAPQVGHVGVIRLATRLRARTSLTASVLGAATAAAMLAWCSMAATGNGPWRLGLLVLCGAGGWLGGYRAGQMIALGPLGWLLDRELTLSRHSRAAQLLGELFGLQTLVMTIPVVYFGTWASLIHAGAPVGRFHASWSYCYTTLFGVSVLIELTAFLLPLMAYAGWLWRRPTAGRTGY